MPTRPILFSGEMVRAILDGTKTQTRRVAKLKLGRYDEIINIRTAAASDGWIVELFGATFLEERLRFCPYGNVGDRLWVRETWSLAGQGAVRFKADGVEPKGGRKWKPSIHMPRWISRTTLKVTGVRLERLHEMPERDAKAEGVQIHVSAEGCPPGKVRAFINVLTPYMGGQLLKIKAKHLYRAEFAVLWETLNAKRGFGWEVNPLVWVIKFRRIKS